MKRIFLLTSLSILFTLFTMNVSVALPQNNQTTTDEVAQLKISNALLKIQVSQLMKQRTLMQKQLQQDESNMAGLKAQGVTQESAIAELNKTVATQQAALDKVPEAIAERSYLFGKKRMLAVGLIILSFLSLLVYVLRLKKEVADFNKGLKTVEDHLDQKQMRASAELKEYLSKETADLKAMLERQTHENKNRIIALLADTNRIVHNVGDEINKGIDVKIANLKEDLGKDIFTISEKAISMDRSKSTSL